MGCIFLAAAFFLGDYPVYIYVSRSWVFLWCGQVVPMKFVVNVKGLKGLGLED
jgi:hypothetical protein